MTLPTNFTDYPAGSSATYTVTAETTNATNAQVNANTTAIAALPSQAVYVPSDPTGVTDMTTELQAFAAVNPGKLVKVRDGSTILLTNAFATVTSGDILLDFSNCTILYNNLTNNDYAIQCNNVANASSLVTVNSLATATVNTDATVTQLTLASTLSAKRFDWIAITSTDANPAKTGGQYGEIFQLLADETSLVLTATRKLNNYGFYATAIQACKLDATRRVYIKGGIIKANGNTESHSITARAGGILVQGFVDPVVENVVFDHPWGVGLRFQCTAQAKARDISMRNVGNLASFNGFTYGVYWYGMNDGGDARDLVVRNGRHPATTTDGNSSNTTTWYAKGIPTNLTITGVRGYNCHGSVIDTHEEGDGIVFNNIQIFYSYQDADISPGFTGLGCQIRAARVTVKDFWQRGGTQGIRINAVDHGFEDQLHLENIHIESTTQGTVHDNDIGVFTDDMSALTNNRAVYISGVFNDVGTCVIAGKKAKITYGPMEFRRCYTAVDCSEGSVNVFTGTTVFDYRNDSRTAPFFAVKCRSSLANGGATVIFMTQPHTIKGTDVSPVAVIAESDTTASKPIYLTGFTEYNPSGVTATVMTPGTATTFTNALVSNITAGPVEVVRTRPLFAPADHGLLAWPWDPTHATAATLIPTAGTIFVVKLHMPATGAVTKIWTQIITAGATLTASENFAGIYQGGTLLGATADQSTAWLSNQVLGMTIAGGPVTVTAGDFYVAMLWNGTTAPKLPTSGSIALINVNLVATASRYGTANTAQTSLPGTLGTVAAGTFSMWMGVS